MSDDARADSSVRQSSSAQRNQLLSSGDAVTEPPVLHSSSKS